MPAKKSAPKVARKTSSKTAVKKAKAKPTVAKSKETPKVEPKVAKEGHTSVNLPQEARVRLAAFKIFCLASFQPLYKGGVKASLKRAFAGLWPAWLVFAIIVLSILVMPTPPATMSKGALIAVMVPIALVLLLLNIFLWQSSRFVEQVSLKILYRATALLVIFTCLTALVVPVTTGLVMVYNYFFM